MAGLLRRILYSTGSVFSWDYRSYLSTRAKSQKWVYLGRGGTPWISQPTRNPKKWVQEGVVCESSASSMVALTFDDGPTPGVTEKILDILKQYQAHATFFLIGRKVHAGTDLMKRALEEGHRLGNHTFHHHWVPSLTTLEMLDQVRMTQDSITTISGKPSRWFRPPYGALRLEQEKYVVGDGLQIAYWSVNSKDWQRKGHRTIASKVRRELHPGAVVVMHDVHKQTVEALPLILDDIARRGWRSVTLSEMFPRPQHNTP